MAVSTKLWREQREISPERTLVWTEPSSNAKIKRVPVVYYLSRNGRLEHPHFMEVPVCSSQGLYLTDVIDRLNVLRGKGMATMYSWSCKRSYKNGFVWQDLSENDFIYPAHGHEYVLKGSELPVNTFLQTSASFPRLPPPPESQIAGVDPHSSDRRLRNQSCSSFDFNQLNEYSVYKSESFTRSAAASDASTQTDDNRRRRRSTKIAEEKSQEPYVKSPHRDEIEIEISPPPSDSSPETLETLMKADGRLIQRHKGGKEDPTASSGSHSEKSTKSSVLMQLISCGSISFKDCGAGSGVGLMSQYKMRLPRGGRVKLEEKEYFSGSLVETKKEIFPALKRSTSCNADRI